MKLSTKVIPISIDIPFKSFIKHYKLAKINNDIRSKEILLLALDKQFVSWNEMFVTNTYDQDITLLTLFKTLAKDDRPKDLISNKLINVFLEFKP